jgi:hypothetical protein
MTSPLSIGFSQMCRTSARTPTGRPAATASAPARQRLAGRLREALQHRGVEQARRDRHDADQLSARSRASGSVMPDDAALAGAVGGLADLPVEGRGAGGVDDDAALAVDRRRSRHRGAARRSTLKVPTRLTVTTRAKASSGSGPALAEHPARRADAGAVDGDPQRAELAARVDAPAPTARR